MVTIKSFNQIDRFMDRQRSLLDDMLLTLYLEASLQIWFNIRLALITSLNSLAISLIASQSYRLSSSFAAMIGLSLTFAFQISPQITTLLNFIGAAEAEMNAVERLSHYGFKIPQEDQDGKEVSLEWPTSGTVVIKELDLAYSSKPNQLVIKSLSLSIQKGEKVAIVGRTGSGKSSLISAIYRTIDIKRGSIFIDQIDNRTVPLKTLRQRIHMIPQNPVLFSGTVRTNLDYSLKFSDAEIWEALQRVGLTELVSTLTGQLDAEVDETGSNFSAGQIQMLLLARAILMNPKVLIMDEATAHVDSESDGMIQRIVLEYFKETTVISIAHRLESIMGFDKVIVLENGHMVECGSPSLLLEQKGKFYHFSESMVGLQ
jgi:ABC-type multidrug transport system fused ATPase/permease subunit